MFQKNSVYEWTCCLNRSWIRWIYSAPLVLFFLYSFGMMNIMTSATTVPIMLWANVYCGHSVREWAVCTATTDVQTINTWITLEKEEKNLNFIILGWLYEELGCSQDFRKTESITVFIPPRSSVLKNWIGRGQCFYVFKSTVASHQIDICIKGRPSIAGLMLTLLHVTPLKSHHTVWFSVNKPSQQNDSAS